MRGESHAGQRRATGARRAAVMAAQRQRGGVEDERPLALGADLHVAAVAADDDRRAAAPIDEQDRLIAGRPIESAQARRPAARDSRPRLPAASSARRSTTSTRRRCAGDPLGQPELLDTRRCAHGRRWPRRASRCRGRPAHRRGGRARRPRRAPGARRAVRLVGRRRAPRRR